MGASLGSCDGALYVVEGPAGIGKSSVLAATARDARRRGCEVLAARCSELEHEFAFGAVRQLFESRLAQAAPPERDGLLSGAAALAASLFETGAADDARAAAFDFMHGLYWLTVGLAVNARCSSPSTTCSGATSRRCAS